MPLRRESIEAQSSSGQFCLNRSYSHEAQSDYFHNRKCGHSLEVKAEQVIHMIDGDDANQYVRPHERVANCGQRMFPDKALQRVGVFENGQYEDDNEAREKENVYLPPVFVPTCKEGESPAKFDQQRLEIELLVQSQQEQSAGLSTPDVADLAWSFSLLTRKPASKRPSGGEEIQGKGRPSHEGGISNRESGDDHAPRLLAGQRVPS